MFNGSTELKRDLHQKVSDKRSSTPVYYSVSSCTVVDFVVLYLHRKIECSKSFRLNAIKLYEYLTGQ